MSHAYTPADGHEWNPLRKYRNLRCACENGAQKQVKVKNCCGRFDTVPHEYARRMRLYLKAMAFQGLAEIDPADFEGV